jgi:signal transduction histidine kinase
MKLQEQSKVTLALEVDRIPPVSGNREKIKGIISNLVINALEAIPGTGELHIWTDESSESVLLHVKDTGVGMREKFLREELFHPFKTTKADGLGIGLFQSRELARQMAGDLTAESQVGKGSVFTLELKKI